MADEENRVYIEAIKMVVGNLQYRNMSIKETFINTVKQLEEYYIMSDKIKYLDVALLYIQVYLEMGFSYEDGRSIFDKIIQELGITKESVFLERKYRQKSIKLNRAQVRSMIGRWPASPHQEMKIDEVVSDIIAKVKESANGIYYYKSVVTNDIYELVINDGGKLFHDIKRRIFYTFE
ncbi:hypothetical protein FMM74_021160 [Lachnospiraceae bacterium MD308]|nr:hypothetical protein [Lachnospiraceae bacterium MD308]